MDLQRENKRLKTEIEDIRYEQEQERERRDAQRDRESRERLEAFRESQRDARGWGDAFPKGLALYSKEAREELAFAAKYPDEPGTQNPWFPQQVEQIKFAHSAWQEETRAVAPEIQRIRDEAEQQIKALEQQARNQAAARTDAQFGEACSVSEFLRADNYNALVDW